MSKHVYFLVTIPADINKPITKDEVGPKRPEYELLNKGVGGYIESVKLFFEGKAREGYVNEDGITRRLPYNARASEMYRIYWSRGKGLAPLNAQPLLGDAVLIMREKAV